MNCFRRAVCLAACLVLCSGAVEKLFANAVTVTNVALANATNGSAEIHFDLNWQNSWRSEWTDNGGQTYNTNWDAAYVFVKCRVSAGAWQPVWFNTNGNLMSSGSPAGMVIDVATNGGTVNPGVFIHRTATGQGTVSLTNIVLSWNYQAGGLYSTNQVDIAVFATEMVYVPQGPFLLGSGSATETGSFETFTNRTSTFFVTNENAMTMGPIIGALNYVGNTTTNVLPAAYPKGYRSFYLMKYEISQGQYADFLNHYAGNVNGRYSAGNFGNSRFTIAYTNGTNFVASAPDRACNYLSWDDLCAFAEWTGLRPVSELEFEKASRGFGTNSPNEFAFGSGVVTPDALNAFIGTDGSGTETVATVGANIIANENGNGGPARVGIFATIATTRNTSGAGYFGNMELSGNVWEQCVNATTAAGLLFSASNGDGGLIVPSDWPAAGGGGWRGGDWYFTDPISDSQVSDRTYAGAASATHNPQVGGRCARTAP